MRDKRTLKDVCGEAIVIPNSTKRDQSTFSKYFQPYRSLLTIKNVFTIVELLLATSFIQDGKLAT